MNPVKLILSVLLFAVLLTSCDKNDVPGVENPDATEGLYILNEGGFGRNNTSLSFYNLATSNAITDYYANSNGGQVLGDTGNDLLLYGSKIYIVMNGSNYIRVADALTADSLRRIPFGTRGPRYAVAANGKVFVTAYDGTVAVIDTVTMAITKNIPVGANPEQMVISGNNLYVTNSGGLQAVMDSTISVIDLTTLTETRKITVGVNPGAIAADESGNVYVGCTGNYGDIGPKLVKVNTGSQSVIFSADTAVGRIRFYNGMLYATGGYLGTPFVRTLRTTDFSATAANFVSDETVITTPYGLNIDPANGDVYVTDAKDYASSGEVFCFGANGRRKFSFSVAPGVSPNTVVFLK